MTHRTAEVTGAGRTGLPDTPPRAGRIVVGVDGSASALAAAVWAAREAGRRGATLELVTAVDWTADPARHPDAAKAETRALGAIRAAARRHVARAAERVVSVVPGLPTECRVRAGVPATVLVEASAEADLVVLGGPGGGWTGSLTVVAMAGLARCPLVVVGSPLPAPDDAPVVVGVDGSGDGDSALGFAVREAYARGVPLEVVHAWTDTALDRHLAPGIDFSTFADDVRAAVYARIERFASEFPTVRIRHVVVRDRPDEALAERSRGAQLVVVGARGRHTPAGLPLGEISRRTMYLAGCPVVVVGRPVSR
ncbi:MAG: universal stress protein [Pseudonocardia sp.]|nr:universal stress protein [Pseudonocardia sp.]